jgi:predicted GIY-YIG superfamily endonuclease
MSGKACRTTKVDPPVALLHSEEFETFSVARRREAQVKRWTRAKKEALVSGNTAGLKALAKCPQNQRRKKSFLGLVKGLDPSMARAPV